jgi:hypothetical protein
MLQMFLSGCSIRFAMAFQVFSCVFASVSDVSLKCFIYHQTHGANVLSECFKSKWGVAHVAI